MTNIVIIDKVKKSGNTGKIVRLIKYISTIIENIDDVSNIFIKYDNEWNNTMNCIFMDVDTLIPDKTLIFDKSVQEKGQIGINLKNIKANNNFNTLKSIAQKIKFINMDIPNLNNITNKTLGIHIRLTDMNETHGNIYGIKTYDDYKNAIKKYLDEHIIDNIFLASDNKESIVKLQSDFPNIKIYYNSNTIIIDKEIRNNKEKTYECGQNPNDFKNEFLYKEVLYDVFCLSKCKSLIYRTSNVSNLAILLSNTLENIVLI